MAKNPSWLVFFALKHTLPLLVWIFIQRLHKLVGDGNGNVKVADFAFHLLAANEIQNLRMIPAHHGHVGAMPALLFDGSESGIIYPKKRNGTRSFSSRLFCGSHGGAHFRKIESQPASCLLQESRILEGLKNALHRVVNGEHNAICDERSLASRIGKRAAGRRELPVCHNVKKFLCGFLNKSFLSALAVIFLHLS